MPSSLSTNPSTANRSLSRTPKPHHKIWYPDGNIVLATNNTLFRVHKSVLAEHSSVFRDMFDLATPDNEDTESQGVRADTGFIGPDNWEGLPIVPLLGDSNKDVEYLLRAIYSRRFDMFQYLQLNMSGETYASERSFYRVYERSTVAIVSSLLRMSSKYDLPDLRRDVITHLQRYFPATLEEYKIRDKNEIFTSFGDKDLYQLLALAYQHEVNIVLPVLFYLCSLVDARSYYKNEFAVYLPTHVYKIVKDGRRKLNDGKDEAINDPNDSRASCSSKSCKGRHEAHRARRYVRDYYSLERTRIPLEDDGSGMEPKGFCAVCRHSGYAKIRRIPGIIWKGLPSYFGLPDWKTLLAQDSASTSRE